MFNPNQHCLLIPWLSSVRRRADSVVLTLQVAIDYTTLVHRAALSALPISRRQNVQSAVVLATVVYEACVRFKAKRSSTNLRSFRRKFSSCSHLGVYIILQTFCDHPLVRLLQRQNLCAYSLTTVFQRVTSSPPSNPHTLHASNIAPRNSFQQRRCDLTLSASHEVESIAPAVTKSSRRFGCA